MLRSCPRRHARLAVTALAVAVVAACDHTDAFTAPDTRSDTPRVPGAIARLTYNLRPDRAPLASAAAGAALYQFETGESDRDICLAAMPFTGGTRLREWCANDGQEATRADLFATGALSADGTLAYTQHSSAVFAVVPTSAALYIAPGGDQSRRSKLVDLLRLYPGIPAPVDFLLGPVWTGPDELTALATTATITRACEGCPWDTTYTGQAVVRVRTNAPNQLDVVALVPGASQLVFDPTLDRFAFVRNGAVWTLPRGGGTPTPVYSVATDPAPTPRGFTGLAAGGGALFLTRVWFENETFRSDVARITGGSAVPIPGTEAPQGTWQRAAAAADGRRLIVENGPDLYLVEVTP